MTKEKGSSSKFVSVISQIQTMISQEGFTAGDKLPSERDLSERLVIGRSSVREALRALELLGLIETKRGEGTFLRDFQDHQLVPLIGTFILNDAQQKQHVIEVKTILEMGCLALLASQPDIQQSTLLEEDKSFSALMEKTDNHLLKQIWLIVSDYAGHDPTKEQLLNFMGKLTEINNSQGK